MDQNKHPNTNSLVVYRRRMGFSQKTVAALLGHSDASILSKYEHGHCLPPLVTAFRLSSILRVPVEFLFPALYDELRRQVREQEERMQEAVQTTLPLTINISPRA